MASKERDRQRYHEYRECNPEKYAAMLERKRRDRKRRQEQSGSETERKRRWRAANRGKSQAIRQANHAVEFAIRKGVLVRPELCSKCGLVTAIEAHHHLGYEPDHWLDVMWLCNPCHAKEHHSDRTPGTSDTA